MKCPHNPGKNSKSSPAETEIPNPERDKLQLARRAILDYELVIYEAMALIDLFRTTFIPPQEDCPRSEAEFVKDVTTVGCYQLADGVRTRLYTGFHRIADATSSQSQPQLIEGQEHWRKAAMPPETP